jgi:hypothetical protein
MDRVLRVLWCQSASAVVVEVDTAQQPREQALGADRFDDEAFVAIDQRREYPSRTCGSTDVRLGQDDRRAGSVMAGVSMKADLYPRHHWHFVSASSSCGTADAPVRPGAPLKAMSIIVLELSKFGAK